MAQQALTPSAETSPDAAQRHRDYYLALVDEDREDWARIEGVYPQVQWAWQRQVEGGATVESVLAFVWALRIYQSAAACGRTTWRGPAGPGDGPGFGSP